MQCRIIIAAVSSQPALLCAGEALAAQGPGVGAGSAGPVAQLAAAAIVGGLVAFVAFGLLKALLGRSPPS